MKGRKRVELSMIRCEGSGTLGSRYGWEGTTVTRCQMCNGHFHVAPGDVIPRHERLDILRAIDDRAWFLEFHQYQGTVAGDACRCGERPEHPIHAEIHP